MVAMLGSNHPAALAHPHHPGSAGQSGLRQLGYQVGGHDGLHERVGLWPKLDPGQACRYLLQRQGLAYNPRGAGQDRLRGQLQPLRRQLSHAPVRPEACLAGGAIGVARVDHNRLQGLPRGEQFPPPEHTGCSRPV